MLIIIHVNERQKLGSLGIQYLFSDMHRYLRYAIAVGESKQYLSVDVYGDERARL
jgi:hypothetical protein